MRARKWESTSFKRLVSSYPERPLWRCLVDRHDLRESGWMDRIGEHTSVATVPFGGELWKHFWYRHGWRLAERRQRGRFQ